MSGIRRFIEACRTTKEGFNVSAMSKLFVLNRYVFNVPEFTPLNQQRFGSFLGVPVLEGRVNELWPWQIDPAGELQLTGFFRGYAGESFVALEEAEAFQRLYGRRESRGLSQN